MLKLEGLLYLEGIRHVQHEIWYLLPSIWAGYQIKKYNYGCYQTNKGQNDSILFVSVLGLHVYLCQILNSDGKMRM